MSTTRSVSYLGLDVGSVSIKTALLDSDGRVMDSCWRRTEGRPATAARALLRELAEQHPAVAVGGLMATGSGKNLLAQALGAATVNEIVAHAEASWTIRPEVRSVIEIGGQDAKFIRVARSAEGRPFIESHAFNELCAAGTGAFLDQMAGRIGLDVAAFGDLAAAAPRAAHLAGRCAVFAKTDIIHLQQRAAPPDEIALGLCFALARTYLANLCKGVAPAAPVLFQGGVARNAGVRRAFRELLRLDEENLITPAETLVMGALGAALLARRRQTAGSPSVMLMDLATAMQRFKEPPTPASDLPPLVRAVSSDHAFRLAADRCGVGDASLPATLFLGVDVGSTSTKAAAVDADGRLLASSYLPTAGAPIEAIRKAVAEVASRLPHGATAAAVATTGSGRHLARELLRADDAADEITAQARSATLLDPEADTIIEIGGQDAKFIRLDHGGVSRFQMNRACAAGTGAFLEEQAGRLGLSITEDFSREAFAAREPVRLGDRCTVFMDSDLVHFLQHGARTSDLCAGLAYAVARNYLEKVVGSAPMGKKVLLHGGVARNDAVAAAFRQLLGVPVRVHPNAEISGAHGAALLALDHAARRSDPSLPRPFTDVAAAATGATTTAFTCHTCENLCEIQRISMSGGRDAYFGSICGRFEGGLTNRVEPKDAFSVRHRLLTTAGTIWPPAGVAPRGSIGLPLALTMYDHLPFWRTLLSNLGFHTVVSPASTREIIDKGLGRVPAEFCYPMKVLFGHVHYLMDKGLTRLFIPFTRRFIPEGEHMPRYACPYTQSAPYVVASTTTEADVLTLELPVPDEEEHWLRSTAETLASSREELRRALMAAREAQRAFEVSCRKEGDLLLNRLHREGRRGAVLLGRPYNTADRLINLNLARRLKTLDIEPIPYDFLPLADEELPAFWDRIRWGYGRRLTRAARLTGADASLGAVIVTNFGCGPDSFVDQYLEHELSGTPHLVLEFDDHHAEAGLVTRLEAFARTMARGSKPTGVARPSRRVAGPDPGKSARPRREFTYWAPAISDHSHAFVGALRGAGCRAVLLPPTDEESWNLGLRHAYGRECHPFVCFLGDLLKASARPDFVARDACYFGPSYFGPCLLPQYILAMKLVLDRVGLGDVTLLNFADPNTMKDLGYGYLGRLAAGLYAIDRLYKWKVESEPYEREPGRCAAVHAENMIAIEEGLATGRFHRALRESVARFEAIPLTDKAGSRPRIGVIGDAYTRINTHANDNLYRRLEGLGFEVWPSSSLIDVSFLGMEQLHEELRRKGQPARGAAATGLLPLIRLARGWIDRYFPPHIRTPQERQFPAVAAAAKQDISPWIDKSLTLNLSRVEELADAGADGVVNVMCHNCMLGTVTASLLPAVQRRYPRMTMQTLIYEGLQSTHAVNRLEALAHQIQSQRGVGDDPVRTLK